VQPSLNHVPEIGRPGGTIAARTSAVAVVVDGIVNAMVADVAATANAVHPKAVEGNGRIAAADRRARKKWAPPEELG
jgi:hypothetical protein